MVEGREGGPGSVTAPASWDRNYCPSWGHPCSAPRAAELRTSILGETVEYYLHLYTRRATLMTRNDRSVMTAGRCGSGQQMTRALCETCRLAISLSFSLYLSPSFAACKSPSSAGPASLIPIRGRGGGEAGIVRVTPGQPHPDLYIVMGVCWQISHHWRWLHLG